MTEDNPLRKAYLEIFKENMAAIGIEVGIELLLHTEWYGFGGKLTRRDFEIGVFPWLAGPDPGGAEIWASNQMPTQTNGWRGNNYPGWQNAQNDEIWEKLAETLIASERQELYARQQALFSQDLPVLPLFQRLVIYAADPNTTTLFCHSEEQSDEESRSMKANCRPKTRFFAPYGRSE